MEAAFTETYTFYTNSDDGVRLWVDGQLLIENWTDHGNTEDSGTIDLVADETYSIVMEMYENRGGAVAELCWESPRTPKQLTTGRPVATCIGHLRLPPIKLDVTE